MPANQYVPSALSIRRLIGQLYKSMNYENVFTISSSAIHFRGVYSRVKGGENP
ncbi:MAG: hypothetical protein OJF50_004492 [Nitrospira sp.]|nr:hypothetical protein [Nitrospira sp.]